MSHKPSRSRLAAIRRRPAGGRLALALAAGLAVAGCEGGGRGFEQKMGGEPVYFDQMDEAALTQIRESVAASLHAPGGTLRLRPGDGLEVIFHIRPKPKEQPYAVGIGDELAVGFAADPAQNLNARVRPDGWISLPEGDDVRAAGLTIAELNNAIRRQYERIYRDSRVSVRLIAGSSEEERFAQDIESLSQGRAKQVPVMRDGHIALPFLAPLPVDRLTIPQAVERINQAYAARGLDVTVSLLVTTSPGDRIFVFGEVQQPGMVLTDRPQTVLMSVARAGGVTTGGSITDVRVFYQGDDGVPRVRQVNLANVLTQLKLEEDMTLPDGSVVYVPTTALAKTGRVLDQVLRQILFFQGFSVGASYDLNPDTQN